MEEDIKILEEKVELYYDCAVIDEDGFDMRVDIAFMKKDAQALENLIKGYRELEECVEVSSKTLNNVAYDQIPIAIQDLVVSSIPKSKIKEKIEEYKQEMKEIRAKEKGLIWNHRLHKLDYAIEVLQELMED